VKIGRFKYEEAYIHTSDDMTKVARDSRELSRDVEPWIPIDKSIKNKEDIC